MKSILVFAVASLLGTGVQAAVIQVDDFRTAQTAVDTSADVIAARTTATYALDGHRFSRTVSVNQTMQDSAAASLASEASVAGGALAISNGGGSNSVVDLSYDIDTHVPGGLKPLAVEATFGDMQAPLSVECFLDDRLIGIEFVHQAGLISFMLSDGMSAHRLSLRLTGGGSARTVALSGLRLRTADAVHVPEPEAIGIFALALLGLATLPRRESR